MSEEHNDLLVMRHRTISAAFLASWFTISMIMVAFWQLVPLLCWMAAFVLGAASRQLWGDDA